MKKTICLLMLLVSITTLRAQLLVDIEGAATQSWTAPLNGGPFYVRITARGGDGGLAHVGGRTIDAGQGATLSGIFKIENGQTLLAISGARGQDPDGNPAGGGGGGGAGVVNASTGVILLLAGGGGGGGSFNDGVGADITSGSGDGGSGTGGAGGGGLNGSGQGTPSGYQGGAQVSLTGISAGGAGNSTRPAGNGGSGMGGGGGAFVDGGGGGGQTGGDPSGKASSLSGGTCQNNTPGGTTLQPEDGYVKIEFVATTYFFRDADGDLFGNPDDFVILPIDCGPGAGYVTNNSDCDDGNNNIHSGSTFFKDADGDGFGDPNNATIACSIPANHVTNNTDCNDSDPAITIKTTFYKDADGDGFGDPATSVQDCAAPVNYVNNSLDCDDAQVLYKDGDGDGYGDTIKVACNGVVNNTDCRDNNANVYPGAVEVCGNGIDDNCNGQVDENCATICATIVPSFTIEGNTGKHAMIFIVALNKPAVGNYSLQYKTFDGSAKAGFDYQATTGIVTFAKGQRLKFIVVNVVGDKLIEGIEQFGVQAYNPVGVKLYGTGKAIGLILDDDCKPKSSKPVTNNAVLEPLALDASSQQLDSRVSKVYPNPTRGLFNIELQNSSDEKAQVLLLDSRGTVVERRQVTLSKGRQVIQMNLNGKTSGVYFVKVNSDAGVQTFKINLQH